MGVIGGTVGIRLLNYASKNGTVGYPDIAPAYAGKSKLEVLFGPRIWDAIQGRNVIDFGCGIGDEVIEMAQRGAKSVVGIDREVVWLDIAKAKAEKAGVSDRCTFVTEWTEPADLILSLDSFEHFWDPTGVLETMHTLVKPDGFVLVSFGPTWYHPYGGHIYSVFPFSHLIFTESALVRWRAQYKSDGATSIFASGINRMTVRRFRQLVESSPFRFAEFEPVPIRRLKPIANFLTREFTTSIVRCKLVPGVSARSATRPDRSRLGVVPGSAVDQRPAAAACAELPGSR
jgi:SAM-dependent methyltransferase